MWFVVEGAGIICATFTYSIVLTVQVGMIRVGLWERLLIGDASALLHLAVFQYHCGMIFWSHWMCMTTEPGTLPKQSRALLYDKLAGQI